MNAAATIGNTDFFSSELPESCTVVVLYDDAESHRAAMEICERTVSQFVGEVRFAFHCWRLKEFASALFSDKVTGTIADADVIIFATHGEDLPYPVRRCLEICQDQRTKTDGAIGLLLVEPISPSAAIGTLLSRLEYGAARMRMDFLPMFGSADGIWADWEHKAKALMSPLKGSWEQPPSHWGLNE